MTADAFTLLVAIAVPVVALAALIGLTATVRELERSRDELGRIDPARR